MKPEIKHHSPLLCLSFSSSISLDCSNDLGFRLKFRLIQYVKLTLWCFSQVPYQHLVSIIYLEQTRADWIMIGLYTAI